MPHGSTQSSSSSQVRSLKDLTRLIQRAPGFPEVLAALKNGRSATIDGAWGSAAALTAAALGLHAPTTLVILLAHVGDVDDFRDDVATFAGITPEVFPAWEKLPRELNAADEVFGRRLRVLKQPEGSRPAAAGRRAVPGDAPARAEAGGHGPDVAGRGRRRHRAGRGIDRAGCSIAGWRGAEVVEVPGEFSVRGGILDVFPTDATDPVRIEFFGDEVESIRPFDAESQRSLDRWNSVTLTAALGLDEADPASFGHPADFFPDGTWVALLEPNDLREEGRHYLGRVDDRRGLFTRRGELRAADPVPDDRRLDAGRRFARDDLPPADRERRAVLRRPGEGQGRAG